MTPTYEPRRCRNCRYWRSIPPWQGNCTLHPSPRPMWTETASPTERGCSGYTDARNWELAAALHAIYDPRAGRTETGPDPDALYDRMREDATPDHD